MAGTINRFFGTLYRLNLVTGKYRDLGNDIISLADVKNRLNNYVSEKQKKLTEQILLGNNVDDI